MLPSLHVKETFYEINLMVEWKVHCHLTSHPRCLHFIQVDENAINKHGVYRWPWLACRQNSELLLKGKIVQNQLVQPIVYRKSIWLTVAEKIQEFLMILFSISLEPTASFLFTGSIVRAIAQHLSTNSVTITKSCFKMDRIFPFYLTSVPQQPQN